MRNAWAHFFELVVRDMASTSSIRPYKTFKPFSGTEVKMTMLSFLAKICESYLHLDESDSILSRTGHETFPKFFSTNYKDDNICMTAELSQRSGLLISGFQGYRKLTIR